jgi:hypothetical protein
MSSRISGWMAANARTIFNLCIPSEALAWWERRHRVTEVAST